MFAKSLVFTIKPLFSSLFLLLLLSFDSEFIWALSFWLGLLPLLSVDVLSSGLLLSDGLFSGLLSSLLSDGLFSGLLPLLLSDGFSSCLLSSLLSDGVFFSKVTS